MNDAPRAALSLPLWRVERILYGASPAEPGLFVVDKPPGVPVYGGDESLDHSVTARLGAYLVSQGRDPYLAVHQRLDQETSGVLFFVTDEKKNPVFAEAMESHAIVRTYLAVVGPPASRDHTRKRALENEKRVEVWLDHERGETRVTDGRPAGGKGSRSQAKRAVTHYKVLRRAGERALLELKLETGRTHQIRATMAHLGFPVVGDRIYGGAPASRLMLHAASLAGGPLPREFHAMVPDVFQESLEGEEEFPLDPKTALLDAATLRAPLLQQTNALRLVNGEGDGLPGITVDAYGEYAALNIYEAGLSDRTQELAELVGGLGFRGVYVKHRVRADLRAQDQTDLAPAGPLVGEAAPSPHLVDEFGMQVNVDLEDGLSTGLFVDMRDNRFAVRSWARGQRVLNLFCYTGTFSVSAALSGATTTNVDLSGKALDRARANFESNGLDPAKHRFFKEDAMKFLARAVRRDERYDFIVLDPPSFATVGKGTFSVKNKYGEAATECFRLLSPGGRLLCVTNHTKTNPQAFRKIVEEACHAAQRRFSTIKILSAGLDCPASARGPWPSKSILAEIR